MPLIEIVMPKMGESIMEATIITWLKKVGDPVEMEEPLLEVATDKIDTEIPSSQTGILKKILVKNGETIEINRPIAIIETESKKEDVSNISSSESREEIDANSPALSSDNSSLKKAPFYSPLVRNIAQKENIQISELDMIPGTGKENRVTKKDIIDFIKNRKSSHGYSSIEEQSIEKFIDSNLENEEIIEMDRIRKMIATRMVESKKNSPHVTSFIEVDVSHIVTWREGIKETFKQKYGITFTFMPIFIDAIVKAIGDFPMINVSVKGEKIIKKNISILE